MPGVRINVIHPIDAIAAVAGVSDQSDVTEVAVADPVPEKGSGDGSESEAGHVAPILKPAKKNNK